MSDYSQVHKVEEILAQSEALLTGHFLLSSGRHGEKYMQCAKVLQYPNHTEYLAQVIAEGFKDDNVEIVLAPAMGGIIIGYELARALGAKSIFSERENGIMTLRRGFEIPKGARVVIAEDVVTTGKSTKEVIAITIACEAELVGVCSIVDRTGGEIDFGVKYVSAYAKEIISYTPEACPLCKAGIPIVKPGSRTTV